MRTIEKVENGYIVTETGFGNTKRVFMTIDEVFEDLLMVFEGRCDHFGGDAYGRVIIEREKPEVKP